MMEKMGLTPVAARVYVYLLLAAEPGATFEELTSFFSVSKSAVSNALKMLLSTKLAESKTMGGQRKRYFFVHFETMFNQKYLTDRFTLFSNMLDDLRSVRGADDDFGRELKKVSLLYKMLLVEFPMIFERWKGLSKLDNRGT